MEGISGGSRGLGVVVASELRGWDEQRAVAGSGSSSYRENGYEHEIKHDCCGRLLGQRRMCRVAVPSYSRSIKETMRPMLAMVGAVFIHKKLDSYVDLAP
jgi:hypothetical protein